MDSFLEANRLVESSLAKLKRDKLPLRKALFVSNVMDKAQKVATSVHISYLSDSIDTTSTGTPSKLLATMRENNYNEMAVEAALISSPRHSPPSSHKQSVSPVALTSINKDTTQDDEVMEFISNTVLSDILNDEEIDMEVTVPCKRPSSWSPLSDVSNIHWPSWTLDSQEVTSLCSPPSPIKRQHNIAFPCNDVHYSTNTGSEDFSDVTKRFKTDPLLSNTSTANPFISSPLSSWSFNNDNFSLNWSCSSPSSSPKGSPTHNKLYSVLAY